jgi:hypothetical protein
MNEKKNKKAVLPTPSFPSQKKKKSYGVNAVDEKQKAGQKRSDD